MLLQAHLHKYLLPPLPLRPATLLKVLYAAAAAGPASREPYTVHSYYINYNAAMHSALNNNVTVLFALSQVHKKFVCLSVCTWPGQLVAVLAPCTVTLGDFTNAT